jgi:hypothetical protein
MLSSILQIDICKYCTETRRPPWSWTGTVNMKPVTRWTV